jgi:hypothetical protein
VREKPKAVDRLKRSAASHSAQQVLGFDVLLDEASDSTRSSNFFTEPGKEEIKTLSRKLIWKLTDKCKLYAKFPKTRKHFFSKSEF